MRLLGMAVIGTLAGFAVSLLVAFILGCIYAEPLSYLLSDDVVQTAMDVTDWLEGIPR